MRMKSGGRGGRLLSSCVAVIAAATFGIGFAKAADTDNIAKQKQTNVGAHLITCTGETPTSFSFDISWIDPQSRAYLLADRSHGDLSANTEGGLLAGATTGDILYINTDDPTTSTPLKPPANDPFAGVRCDTNADFGGSGAAGRNELTGPNGVFTVNHTEAWAGDGPSYFTPGQTNKAVDYTADPCDSSVRVINLISQQQTDHINLHGCFRTDEGAFDPADQLALFANPSEQSIPSPHAQHPLDDSPFVTLISTIPQTGGPTTHDAHPIVKQINFNGTNGTVLANGGIEQAVWSPTTGKFYIAVPGDLQHPNDGWITVIDPTGDPAGIRVERNIPTPGCNPHGLAIGANDQLFLGCNSGPEEIMNAQTGSITAVIAQSHGGCDEVYFNAGDNQFFGACSSGAGPGQFGFDQVDADPVAYDQSQPTAAGAHSIAADAVTVTTWIPAFAGVCGGGVACVAIYGSSGGDDASVFADQLTSTKPISRGNGQFKLSAGD